MASAATYGAWRTSSKAVHQKVYLDPRPLLPGGGDPLDLVRRAEETIGKIELTRETNGVSPDRDQQIIPAILVGRS